MKISLIGSGNVAWHLSQILESKGHIILEIYSRNLSQADLLSKQLHNTKPTDHLDFTQSSAELLILSVSDDALAQVIHQLRVSPQVILAHTSGSKPLEIFQPLPNPYGVFYPLQTFSKEKSVDFSTIPFCIEGNNETTSKFLFKLASQLSNQVQMISSQQRKSIHLAAVFACNFSNHLFAIAEALLQEENISFEILKPLIRETLDKALELPPQKVQTGPARRNDLDVIQQHLKKLEGKSNDQKIYQVLTQSIIAMYS